MIYGTDICLTNPRIIDRSVCLKARCNDGIRNYQSEGNGVLDIRRITDVSGVLEVQMNEVDMIGNIMPTQRRDNPNQGRVYNDRGVSPCLSQMSGGGRQPMVVDEKNVISEHKPMIKVRQATEKGFVDVEVGGVCDLNFVKSETRRGRAEDNGNICPTLNTVDRYSVIEKADKDFYNFIYEIDGELWLIRIRKLIPLECFRLMGVKDEDFFKAEKVNSNTQLYKQSGNSIVVDCLMALYRNLNIDGVEMWDNKGDD